MLRENNQMLQAIIRASPLAIIVLDTKGSVKLWNSAAETIYGWREQEVLNRPLPTVPPERQAEMEHNHQAGLAGHSFSNYETRRLRKDGTLIDVSISTAPLTDAAGQTTGVVAIVADISARKRAEAELSRREQELTDFMENATVGLHWVGPDGLILWANRAELELLGYTRAEYIGHHIAEFHADQATIDDILTRLSRGDELHGYEARLRCKDGSIRHVLINSNVYWQDGQFIHTRCFTRDITERKRAEDNLLHMAAIVESSDDAIISKNLDGTILSWNPGAARLYGYTAAEIIGQPMTTLIPPDRPDEEPHILARIRRGERVDHYETVRVAKDGTLLDVALTISPVKDPTGRIIGASKIARDITERKRAAESLRHQRDLTTAIITSLGEGLVAVDKEGRVLFANPAAERMFGWTEDELRGRIIHEAVHYKYADGSPFPKAECPLFAAISAGQAVHSDEAFYVRRDGTLFPVAYTASPIISDGQLGGMVQAFQDITERKRTHETQKFLSDATTALAASLDYQQTLDGVARFTVPYLADCCLVDMWDDETDAIRLMVVAHRDPAREEAWREMRRRWPLDPAADYTIPKVLRTGRPEIYPALTAEDLRAVTSDEERVQTLLSFGIESSMIVPLTARGRTLGTLTFISTESGRQYGADELALAEELARRAALAIDNARLYQRAQAANRAKDEFLATLSHELRTPLTPIIGWIHMMNTSGISETDVKHGLGVIDKNSQALARLINDLLDMSAIINGKMRIDHLPVTINHVLQEALETVRPEAARRQIALELTTCGADTLLLVSGDRTRLGQVCWNLLTNAIKFSAPGGRVSLRCETDEQEVRVMVEDEGEGIEPEFLPYVFERFRQADMSTTKPHGGLGIGLALVKSFVEAHGGTVRAESEGAGQGSRFVVRLPRLQLPVLASAATANATGPQAQPPAAPPLARMLLIEDAPDTLELLRLAFARRNYHVTTCESAAAALAVAAREHFDIIISDIGLPHIDGYDLLARLRRVQPALRTVPAVALTGYATAQDVAAAHAAGFAAHVAKPIDPATLARVVEQLLAQRAPEGEP